MRRRSQVVALAATAAAVLGGVSYQAAFASGRAGPTDATSQIKQALEAQDRLGHERLAQVAKDPQRRQAALDLKSSVDASHAPARQVERVSGSTSWPTGIFQDSEAPAPGSQFLGVNRWVGVVDGSSVAVYAGRDGEDPTVGRLLIMVAGPDGDSSGGATVDVPGAGVLRVSTARGHSLTIIDSEGVPRVFDATTRTWSN